MYIKNYMIEKSKVKYCVESLTVEQAFEQLKLSGYRSIPVLDDKEQRYMGSIEKLDIYEYLFEQNGDRNDNLSVLLKSKDNIVCSKDNFVRMFLDKDVGKSTFFGVENEKKEFVGIITHAKLLGVLKDGFGISKGGYLMTLAVVNAKGTLETISHIINKYASIKGVMALDDDHMYARRITLSIPLSVSEEQLHKLNSELQHKGVRMLDCVKVDGSNYSRLF